MGTPGAEQFDLDERDNSVEPVDVEIAASLQPLIPGYLENRRTDAAQLRAALDAGDLESVARIGHRLKGNGASYGFDFITRIGEMLEVSARADDRAAATAACEEYGHFLARLRVVFK